MHSTKVAFTLAEVLITLGIIGVLAAILIPTVLKDVQNAELKTGFKKSYSVLNQALNKTISENGNVPYGCYYNPASSYTYSECSNFWKNFKTQLNIIKEYAGSVDGINIPDYTGTDLIVAQGGHNSGSFDGGKDAQKNSKTAWTFADGSMLFSYRPSFFVDDSGGTLFILDTNGLKKPNKWGYDLFMLVFWQKDDSSSIAITDTLCGSQEKGGYNISDILTK